MSAQPQALIVDADEIMAKAIEWSAAFDEAAAEMLAPLSDYSFTRCIETGSRADALFDALPNRAQIARALAIIGSRLPPPKDEALEWEEKAILVEGKAEIARAKGNLRWAEICDARGLQLRTWAAEARRGKQ